MKPLHLAAALLMVTSWGCALRASPVGNIEQIPFPIRRGLRP